MSVDLLDVVYLLFTGFIKEKNPTKFLYDQKSEKRSVGPNCVYGKEKKSLTKFKTHNLVDS